jgi:lipoprotein NlpI
MKRSALAGLLGFVLSCLAACDKSSRDANTFTSAGVTHLQRGERDRAIRDFDRALAIRPGLMVAWRNRGLAYKQKGDFERALADYDQAILLSPSDARIYNDRGAVYESMNDYPRAIQDFDRAVTLKPDLAPALENRGRTHFYLGNFAQAAADLQRGLSFDSSNVAMVVWLHLARQRLDQDDASDFVVHAAVADTLRWPAPILQYFLGRVGAGQLRTLTEATEGESARARRCTVAFYLGEDALLRGRTEEAATLFGETRESCPRDLAEYRAAVAELQRLRQTGRPPLASPHMANRRTSRSGDATTSAAE